MGVPGLWDLLRPAATRTSLSTLARESFYSNKNGLRALTVGIDASIWIFHAQIPQYGENPFLRTIFFKITSLLQQPVLPVFVFDGPNKPPRKRGERVAGHFGTSDHRSKQLKELLDACGLEWWNAPGEAEAELAIMNRQGKIDAVLSDDVDALLFGATCLLRNNSPTLSGTQAASTQGGVAKPGQYEMYRSSAIVNQWTSKEDTSLKTEEDCRMAMVWIALLGGGDYAPEGLPGFGPTITSALANAGLASFLHRHKSGSCVNAADAARVHAQMIEELRTNATGHLGRRYKDRAAKLADVDPASLFPTGALDAYLRPATSPLHDPSQGWPGFGHGETVFQKRGKARMEGRGDLVGFAKACERFFEWGTKDLVAKKFASESVGLFGSELVTCARERVRRRDPSVLSPPIASKQVDTGADSTPSSSTGRITSFFQQSTSTRTRQVQRRQSFENLPSHVVKIHSVRSDPTNSELNEYRVSFVTCEYIKRCHEVMDGHRVDPKELDTDARAELGLVEKDTENPPASQAVTASAKEEARLWISEYLVKEAWPELVEAYEAELAAKAKPKSRSKSAKSTKKLGASGENTQAFKSFFLTHRPVAPSQPASSDIEEEEVLENLPPRMTSVTSSRSSTRSVSANARTGPGTSSPLSSPPPVLSQMKKNARPAPNSCSSSSSTAAPTRTTVRSTRATTTTASHQPPVKVPSPRRTTRRSTRTKTAQRTEYAVIDLCSSDDESPPVPAPSLAVNKISTRTPSTPPRTILGQISKSNSPSPSLSVAVKPASKPTNIQTSKSKPSNDSAPPKSTQTLLSMPTIKPMKDTTPSKATRPPSPAKAKAPLFVVTYEDDERVEMDVRGRWARGESVGAWDEPA